MTEKNWTAHVIRVGSTECLRLRGRFTDEAAGVLQKMTRLSVACFFISLSQTSALPAHGADEISIFLHCDAHYSTASTQQDGSINIRVSKDGKWLELSGVRFPRTKDAYEGKWRFDASGARMFDLVDFSPKDMTIMAMDQKIPLIVTGTCTPITNPFDK